ncbi:MAG TPA: hypothetical protein VG298_17865, partial [Acidimicrobiales bacterium]|nr:hypothetical protein [Acidimicrobiales bacterium]
VDVALPDGGYLHCYIPLSAMGTPAPTKAREVLTKGVVRPFVLAGLDPPRRVAELALPAPGAKPAAPAAAAVAAKRAPAPAAKKPRSPAKKAAKTAKAVKTAKVAKTAKAAKAAKSAPGR